MSRVLVTDASKREALAIIRSLGKKGIEVTAADSVSFNSGFLSKYCKHRVLYPSPENSKASFLKSMLRLVEEERFDVLIPVSDFTVVPLSQCKEDFEKYTIVAVPEYDTLLKAFDKAQTIQTAMKCGVPHPKTFIVEDIGRIREIAKEVRYPAVIKPRRKVVWNNDRAMMLKVTQKNYATNSADMVDKYLRFAMMLDKFGASDCLPLVQEYVAGEGVGVEVLMSDTKPTAVFMHKRIREYPLSGGASTLRESIVDETLGMLAIKLLRAMNWEGVAMVEFKVHRHTSEPMLMEVNGRFWGSLALAIEAGVDFPFLVYETAMKEKRLDVRKYRIGVKQRWLIPGDILWLFSSLSSSKHKFASIKTFIRDFAVPDDVIALDDPAPTLGALADMTRDWFDVMMGRRTLEGETSLA